MGIVILHQIIYIIKVNMDKNAPKYIGQFLVDAKGGTYWSADGNTK